MRIALSAQPVEPAVEPLVLARGHPQQRRPAGQRAQVALRLVGIEVIQYTTGYMDAGLGLFAIILIVCVQPALIEELAFRGVILKSLGSALTRNEAIIVSSMMFAVMHISPINFPHTFLMGMVAAWMVMKTRSIWPGVILHFMHNFLVIATELWWSW